jgi:hypothetical protein
VSNDSIKEALFSISNDKAPGPDGYSSLFSKQLGTWLAMIYVLLYVIFLFLADS